MLTEDQIAHALHAGRVVALPIINPHGPIGLEHLAEIVGRHVRNDAELVERVQRPIALPVETWEKLDSLARAASTSRAPPLTASDLAAALLQQAVAVK
ncbi:MAG TPA: hypothetical protein VF306_09510 [Pirellulales bacterium]